MMLQQGGAVELAHALLYVNFEPIIATKKHDAVLVKTENELYFYKKKYPADC